MSRLGAGAAVLAALFLVGGVAGAEVAQNGNLRVSFEGKLSPRALPRVGRAPVSVTLGGEIRTTDGHDPPQLRRIVISLNRHGHLDYRGLPRCNFHQIQPATTVEAARACRRSLVGRGSFRAKVVLPEQSPFPSNGTILAFNGNLHGKPVIYAHIYGTTPLPTSFVLPFQIRKRGSGYGTDLVALLPQIAAEWGHVSGVSLTLGRNYRFRGARRSYLSAGCPAPAGFSTASFALAKATFSFEDGREVSSTLVRTCGVRR